MEGTNSAAVFESLNLSPQLFINEVLNIVDDLLDEAFDFFLREASALLKTEGTDRSAELNNGVARVRGLIQSTLDQRMQRFEEYCLRFPFRVPEGFSLPKNNELSGEDDDDSLDLDALTDTEMDAQLNSLHSRLEAVGKESAKLSREVRALERQSLSSSLSAGSIDEALQLYEKHDGTQLFRELTNTASEFRAKLQDLKRKRVEEKNRCDRSRDGDGDLLRMPRGNGLFGAKLEQLQEFLDEITTS